MTTQQEIIDAINTTYAERDEAIDDLNAARAELALAATALAQARADLDMVKAERDAIAIRNAELTATIVSLKAEIKRLEDIINPPPVEVRVTENYGTNGGGGIDEVEVLPDGSVIVGTDVGAHARLAPGSWEGLKWNLGLTGARHIASLTPLPDGGVLSHGGSPGSQEGVFIFDPVAATWSGPIPGSTKLTVNSQNSYGDPNSTVPSAWKFGYGTWEQRSVGRLTWMRDNGDLVCGQFGYAGGGKGGVAVLSNGVKRIIPGTENWACRAVQRLSDREYRVSVEKQRVSNTALPTPGGLWSVDVDSNQLLRLSNYPDTPEHIDFNGADLVVACRNAGIARNGQDITFNLPRASEWYSVAINDRGDILAGCMDPKKGTADERYWSVAVLWAGSTLWTNLTPNPLPNGKYLETLNSAEPFAAVNRANTLGNPGATVTDVAWRGDIPVCSASGIVWGSPLNSAGVMEPAPGSWIIVNRAYDRTPDGYEAFASSDFRAMWRKPNSRWEKAPFSGGNDGADVSWVTSAGGQHVLHYRGPGGERQLWNADIPGGSSTTASPMPPKNPEAPMTAEKRAEILATMEVKQFGPLNGSFAIDEETLVIWEHGGAISRMVEA